MNNITGYESPITLLEQVSKELNESIEEQVYTTIQDIGVAIDKEELIKALNYDRNQYEEGYKKGYMKAKEELKKQIECIIEHLNSINV